MIKFYPSKNENSREVVVISYEVTRPLLLALDMPQAGIVDSRHIHRLAGAVAGYGVAIAMEHGKQYAEVYQRKAAQLTALARNNTRVSYG